MSELYTQESNVKIKLRISIFGALMLLFLLFGDRTGYSSIAIFAAILHELGHITAAYLLKIKINGLSIGLMGARLNVNTPMYSYSKESVLAAAGPAVNLLGGLVSFYIFRHTGNEKILFFSIASGFLACLNLLPIKSFDGGRIFLCLIAPAAGIFTAEKLLDILSFLLVLLLWMFSMYMMLRVGSSVTLFTFSSALFAELFLDHDCFSH